MKPKHFREPEVEVWEENWPAIQWFIRFATQWRMGMGGPVGLDYSVILHEMDRQGLSGDERDNLLDALQVIESARLDQIYKE